MLLSHLWDKFSLWSSRCLGKRKKTLQSWKLGRSLSLSPLCRDFKGQVFNELWSYFDFRTQIWVASTNVWRPCKSCFSASLLPLPQCILGHRSGPCRFICVVDLSVLSNIVFLFICIFSNCCSRPFQWVLASENFPARTQFLPAKRWLWGSLKVLHVSPHVLIQRTALNSICPLVFYFLPLPRY